MDSDHYLSELELRREIAFLRRRISDLEISYEFHLEEKVRNILKDMGIEVKSEREMK